MMDTICAIIDFLNEYKVLTIIVYILLNILLYGFKGIVGGIFPHKVKSELGDFWTFRRDAYRSERLTRIVQWRSFKGAPLPKEIREALLKEYGPSANKCLFKGHYKNVIKKEVNLSNN